MRALDHLADGREAQLAPVARPIHQPGLEAVVEPLLVADVFVDEPQDLLLTGVADSGSPDGRQLIFWND